MPPKNNLPRLYGSHKFTKEQRENKFLNIVSSENGDAKVKIHQDVNLFVSELNENKTLEYKIKKNRQVYFIQIEGKASINGIELNDGDALEITDEKQIDIKTISNSHFLFIEMSAN